MKRFIGSYLWSCSVARVHRRKNTILGVSGVTRTLWVHSAAQVFV